MKMLEQEKKQIEQEILTEEFRYWDAQRNGCADVILEIILNKINNLKAEIKMIHTVDLKQLYLLHENEQAEILTDAIKLAERRTQEFRFELFQLEGMYIEVRWLLKGNVRKGVRVFENPDILDPYLEQMNISDFQE